MADLGDFQPNEGLFAHDGGFVRTDG
jgi:hypothetical protein